MKSKSSQVDSNMGFEKKHFCCYKEALIFTVMGNSGTRSFFFLCHVDTSSVLTEGSHQLWIDQMMKKNQNMSNTFLLKLTDTFSLSLNYFKIALMES